MNEVAQHVDNTSLADDDLKELKLSMFLPLRTRLSPSKRIVLEVNYFTIPEEMNIFNVDY
jgi:hypothetical protein